MSTPSEIKPAAHIIYLTGALAGIDRQISHLQAERANLETQIDNLKAKIRTEIVTT